ncbi:MAG TPA: CRISPR-associated protein Cas4 [Chloroflexota bacterium]|nr:CRISPR-associated protein Cas4 [Chloroflexota bacterium]
MSETILTVTDLKQWLYCPRIAYYMRCLPKVRPVTYRMQSAKDAHEDEAGREHRRSLRAYGLADGERDYEVNLASDVLGLRGKVDLVVRRLDEVIPIEYKDSDGYAGRHFLLQLAAYGLLLEEATGLPARRGFLYFVPSRRSRPVELTDDLKDSVRVAIVEIREMVQRETMPLPTPRRERCTNCEFRRFCNDVV